MKFYCLAFFIFSLLSGLAAADTARNNSTTPQPRQQQYEWMPLSVWFAKHAEDVAIAERGDVDLLFLGDSITDGWDRDVWQQSFARYRPANFGIGGDLTQNVLWRLHNGTDENLEPQVVVILIGVNNIGHGASPQETARGVEAVVRTALEAYPRAHLVLHGIFPFEQFADHPNRQAVKAANQLIEKLDALPRVSYHDFGDLLLQDDGSISPDIMEDFLHPTPAGYRIWADALVPVIQPLLAADGTNTAQEQR